MGLFDFMSGGGSSNVVTLADPYKAKISEKITPFLESRIGKGLPSYKGQLYEELNPNTVNNMNQFLSLNPTDWFNKYVADPSIKDYQENQLPDLRESFAGGLRGSGRYTNELSSMNDFYSDLAQKRGQAELDIPKAQFDMASNYKKLKDLDYLLEYNNWYTSLPETNPILKAALDFLNSDTGVMMGTDNSGGGIMDLVKGVTGVFGGGGTGGNLFSNILSKFMLKPGQTQQGWANEQNNQIYNDIFNMSGENESLF